MIGENASEKLKVLWLDDQPVQIENMQRVLRLQKSPLELIISETTGEARSLLDCEQFDAVVVDLKLDEIDADEDGAAFLGEVNENFAAIPTLVYSGYLSDPRYAERLKRGRAVMAATKIDELPRDLRGWTLFSTLEECARRYRSVADKRPETVKFHEYLQSPNRFRAETDAHWTRHGHWITREMANRDAAWIVVCGRMVVASSPHIEEYPDEPQLLELGQQYNLVPFAYASPAMPEECLWCKVSPNDYYPTVDVLINSRELTEDFDTGAQMTTVSDHIVQRGHFDFLRSNGVHLARDFKFFTRKVPVTIRDVNGVEKSLTIPVQVIENWMSSPFVAVNKTRTALIGRDILRDFDCEITLNSSSRKTSLRHLS